MAPSRHHSLIGSCTVRCTDPHARPTVTSSRGGRRSGRWRRDFGFGSPGAGKKRRTSRYVPPCRRARWAARPLMPTQQQPFGFARNRSTAHTCSLRPQGRPRPQRRAAATSSRGARWTPVCWCTASEAQLSDQPRRRCKRSVRAFSIAGKTVSPIRRAVGVAIGTRCWRNRAAKLPARGGPRLLRRRSGAVLGRRLRQPPGRGWRRPPRRRGLPLLVAAPSPAGGWRRPARW